MSDHTPRKRFRFFDPAKTMEIVLAAVLAAVLAVVFAGFVPFSHPRLTKAAVTALKRSGADSCAIGSVRITFWKGVSARTVSLSATTRDGTRYALHAHGVDVRCNLLFIALYRAKFYAVSGGERATFGARSGAGPIGVLTDILRIARVEGRVQNMNFTDARLVAGKNGERLLDVDGISLALTIADDQYTCSGSFSLAGATVSGVAVADRMEGGFFLDGGCLTISECKGKTNGGKFSCRARLDLEKAVISAVSLSVDGLDVSRCRLDSAVRGRLEGKADFRITLDSSDFHFDSLRGKGTLHASPLVVSGFSLQRSLVGMFAYPGFAHVRFKKFKSDFTIKPGRIIETLAHGNGDSLSVKISGWFRADGMVDKRVECLFPGECVAGLPPFIQRTLEVTAGGGRRFRCRVYGMIDNPKFAIDSEIILRKAVQNMFEDVRDQLQQWLK